MKNGKLLFIAIIFLVSFLCISAASAADDAASDIIADANEGAVLEESIDDAVLEDLVQRGLHVNGELVLIGGPDEHILVLDDVVGNGVCTGLVRCPVGCGFVIDTASLT